MGWGDAETQSLLGAQMTTDILRVQLLGEFRLAFGDQLVTVLHSRRLQSLLTYLLLHRSAPQPRQHLAFLLWPDSPEAQARTNLRNLLHRLRHAWPEADAYLLEDKWALVWRDDAPLELDVAGFEAALAQSKQAEAARDPGAAAAALECAVGAYGGDLLPGCYDEWILPHRERLHQAFLDALERLIALQESQRQYRQAIGNAQRLLRYDPLHEAAYQRLMRLYEASGDRTGALRAYRTCAAVLKRELDVEPDRATTEMVERILAAEPGETARPVEPDTASPGGAARTPGNLPYQLTSFVGRERERAEVRRLLAGTRLLTLTGAPGSGKTRLGLAVAAQRAADGGRWADGACWVELAALTDAALVPQAVAAALGIREKPDEALTETLIDWLRERSALLVLDNCEHLVEATSALATTLLRACPRLHILATSREAFGVLGEIAWPVPPLSYPNPPIRASEGSAEDLPGGPGLSPDCRPAGHLSEGAERLRQYESVHLFVERATAALPTFRLTDRNIAAVARICGQLEGIPLAIELAAARVKMMAVEQIAARLDDAVHILRTSRRDGLPRHQTLQAAIDWSYELLPAGEQRLLRQLAVFAGGFTLEAAEQVVVAGEGDADSPPAGLGPSAVLDLLSHLIDKSLVEGVHPEQTGEVRYRLLETVRQYAWDRLVAAGEAEGARRRHAHFYVALAEAAEPKLLGPEQTAWMNRLDLEHDNLRAALAWARGQPGEAEHGLRLAGALWEFWDVRGNFSEGRRWLEEMLALSEGRTPARAKALRAAGALAWGQADYTMARARMSENLALRREVGEKRDIAVGLRNLAIVIYSQGDYTPARSLLAESLALFRELEDRAGIAGALNSLGVVASDLGDFATAQGLYEESLAIRRDLGDKRGIAVVIGNLGVAAQRQGDCAKAVPLLQESLKRYRELGDRRGAANCLNELAAVAQWTGDFSAARALYAESLGHWRELGNKEGTAACLEGSAGVLAESGAGERAALLLGAAEALREAAGSPRRPADQGQYERILARVRAQLSADRLRAAWAEGRTMAMPEALDLAAAAAPPAPRPA